MKKIIALAVAGAFIAPAYAADVTVGGELEFVYVDSDSAKAKITDSDNLIRVTATEELPNGMSITGSYTLIHDSDGTDGALTNDGTNISISGAMGTITVGDTAGALDSTGDYTDVAPSGGSYAMDGPDSTVLWKLPLGVEGLTVAVSHSPDGSNDVGSDDSVKDGENGAAVTYTTGALSVYYGMSSWGASGAADDDYSSFGAKYSINGITVAYESGEKDPASSSANKTEYTGAAVTYKMGDILLGFENQETKTKGSAASVEDTVMFVEYNLGSNVDIYVSAVDDGTTTNNDSTRVGLEYNF